MSPAQENNWATFWSYTSQSLRFRTAGAQQESVGVSKQNNRWQKVSTASRAAGIGIWNGIPIRHLPGQDE